MNQASLFDLTTIKTTSTITLSDIRREFNGTVHSRANWVKPDDQYGQWDAMLQLARSYMVGDDKPMNEYIRSHRSPLTRWQKLAYRWAQENPESLLVLESRSHLWNVYVRGEYIEFALPHHGMGGERHYASRNGKSKILTNLD